jgi:hypothetical protein
LRQRFVLCRLAVGQQARGSSSRLTAFDTVAFDSASSLAAAANDRNSTTFAKIASPSKSGSCAIGRSNQINFGNNVFR